jgi:uncharacterized UPF0160 family protein
MIRTIITHSGTFHADEVFAISILKFLFGHFDIQRTNEVPSKYLEDKNIFVLDIGREYNPEFLNFDHHQDKNYDATIMQVFDFYKSEICRKNNININVNDEELFVRYVKKYLIQYISDVDTGKLLVKESVPTVSTIISNLNNIPNGFFNALKMAENILLSTFTTSKLAVEGKRLFEKFEKI